MTEQHHGLRRIAWLERVFNGGFETRSAPARWPLDAARRVIGRGPDGERDVVLDDARASRRHAEVSFDPLGNRHLIRDLSSSNGTFVDGVRITEAPLSDGAVVRIGDSFFVCVTGAVPAGMNTPEPPAGESLALAQSYAAADLAGPTSLTILIHGPTGAGKELMAARIHEASGRKGPLVAVNCATFGSELLASELFGHTAGAFSGAKGARSGLFASADGGTLFLDEIAELPLAQQPALLRAIQEGKIRPVGSDRELAVDVRIVAATHRDLAALHASGQFREDLYARLAAFVIELPGLARRRTEILALFRKFLGDETKPISPVAAEALLLHDWPQNVRELKHAAERAKLFVKSADRVELSALPPALQQPSTGSRGSEPPPSLDLPPPPAIETEPSREELEAMLARCEGNVAQVARALGKHRQQVYRWLERHGIDAAQFRQAGQ